MTTTATDVGRILLVDQSRGALLFQETILRRREALVTTALAGSEGLQKARDEQPQLIMFGFDLFDMSAPEFCREIRNDERTRGISLLLVCDRENDQHQDLCLAAGCNDVIFRPLQRNDLDAKITRLTNIPTRRELRTLTRIEVSLEKNGRFLIGRSLNISATGMLLELDRVLPGEGKLRLHFYLPGESTPMEMEAEVLRSEFVGTMAKYGLQFVEVNEEERERIEKFVRRLRSRELI